MNILSRLIYLFTAAEQGSVVSHVFSFIGGLEGNFIFQILKNFFLWLFNLILRLIWVIERFVLGIMEALEYIVNTFLGIGTTMDDILGYDTDLVDTLVKTFRALFGVAIVLLIIFTVFAMIKQEYANATSESGMSDENNKKGPIVKKMFLSLMAMIMLPFVMIFIIGALNSVLTAFNNALKGDKNTTIAGQVLATSTFDTNKYRLYAENNKRVPIVISAYNENDYKADEKEKLYTKIKSASIQTKLRNTAYNMGNDALLSFNSALTYENNKIGNSENYGDYYETFVCTAEQYEVFADFIDYCEISNVPFYIKSLADEDVEWKYVDSSVFNLEDLSLTINYRDANDLTANGSKNDTYTITYSMGFDVTSPISDALDSISALLGLTKDENGNYYTYNEMERNQDSVNVVHWANEKASIHFSENFDKNNMQSWTVADQILMYEYYHRSTNNTLGDYTLEELSYENRGDVTLDVYQILYREYYPEADAYSKEIPIECILINGSYYRVVESQYESDGYGNSYYELLQVDGTNFLDKPYSVVTMESDVDADGNVKTSSGVYANLKLSGKSGSAFDLNDPNTWSYTDQILIYEYYSNLSLSNNLFKYDITDLCNGINVPVYTIKDYTLGESSPNKSDVYALINGTYYQLDTSSRPYKLLGVASSSFLEQVDGKHIFSTYSYTGANGDIVINDADSRYGISTSAISNKTINDFVIDEDSSNFNSVKDNISYIFSESDSTPDFALSFSNNFDHRDTTTWSFKDYLLFFIYVKYMGNSGYTTESLKTSPLPGSIGYVASSDEFYFKINPTLTDQEEVFLKVSDINEISDQNMREMLDAEQTFTSNNFSTQDELLFTNVTDPNTVFARTETDSKLFTFSSTANYENVYNWKMSDFLLFLLDNMGYISITVNKNEELQEFSYNSICYRVSTGTGDTQNLYAFGRDKKIYLNEKYILGLDFDGNGVPDYENLDVWLNTGLMSYLTAYITATTNQNIILSEDALLQGLVDGDEFSSTIYSFTTLLRAIVKEYGLKLGSTSNLFEPFGSVSMYQYMNSNEGFYTNGSDLTQWTAFDLMQYAMSGYASGSYMGYLIKTTDGNRRYLFTDGVNNYAVSIESGSFFAADCVLSGKVESSSIELNGKSLSEFYNENLTSSVVSVLSDEDYFYRANNITYVYSKDSGVNTRLDSILAGLGLAAKTEFQAYVNGTTQYLYLGSGNGYDYYVRTENFAANATAYISETAEITPTKEHIFVEDGSYKSFIAGMDQFNVIDAVIAELTGDTTSQTYTKYKFNDGNNHEFIYVGNQFVEVTDTTTSYTVDQLTTKIAGEDNVACINMLMQNYYTNYVVGILPELNDKTSIFYDFSDFDARDVSTWSPLNLILYSEGAMSRTDTIRVSGEYGTTDSGEAYIDFTLVSQNGEIRHLFVDVTNLFDSSFKIEDFIDRENKPIKSENESDFQIELLRYRVAMSKGSRGTDGSGNSVYTYLRPEDVLENYLTLVSVVSSSYNSDVTENILTHQRIKVVDDSNPSAENWLEDVMNEDDVSTWNWLDIVYNYFFSTPRTTDQYICYTDDSGKIYLSLSDGRSQVFVNFDTAIFSINKSFEAFKAGTENVSFSLSRTDNSLIGLLYYKYSGEESGQVRYINFTSSSTPFKVYMVEDYDNEEFVYIFYTGDNSTFGFSVTQSDYAYTTNAIKSNLSEWNIFDLLIKAAMGNTRSMSEVVTSKIYNFGGDDYLLINNYYVNISMLKNKNWLTVPTDVTPSAKPEPLIITVRDGIKKVSDILFEPDKNGVNKSLVELEESSVSVVKNAEEENEDKPDDGDVKLYFSENFDFSDYSTWTNSDFVLYYLFTCGQMDPDITSFQYYVNLGYVPASVYYLEYTDSLGNITKEKVYKVGGGLNNFGKYGDFGDKSIEDLRSEYSDDGFTTLIDSLSNFFFIRDSQWNRQYGRMITNIITFDNADVDLIATYSVSNEPSSSIPMKPTGFSYVRENNQISSDFTYENYYYFVEDSSQGETLKSFEVENTIVNQIVNENYNGKTLVNLKLSEGFKVEDTSTWTRLDYIIMREFARGAFQKSEFSDLTSDYFQVAYRFGAEEENYTYYIYISGFYYNITDAVVYENGTLENKNEANVFKSKELYRTTLASEFNYSFRALVNDFNYVFDASRNSITRELIKTDKTLSFPLTYQKDGKDKTDVYFRDLDNNIDQGAVYKVSLTLLDDYTISPMVKEVSWVEKLMNDMQVIYPDLNWANLIANDGWLDTLGDYYSAYASGEYMGSGNSANITASGMVLSEFLLSVAQTSYDGYADYEYHSVFNDDIIRSLMLSLMGEDNYNNLVLEAQVFVEMFNIAFAQIMDDISYERNIPIVDGNVDNLAMSVYKSYLSTMLLSSDLGEYLYVIATRVLAQYTIYESLAFSTGDYSTFYAYINGYPDENGETVSTFSYGSFQKLVQYENENLRKGKVPTFTFNYADVYRSIAEREVSDDEIMLSLYSDNSTIFMTYLNNLLGVGKITELLENLGLGAITNLSGKLISNIFDLITTLFNIPKPLTFDEVLSKLNTEYSKTYLGFRGCTATFSSKDSTRYSYLIHVYWSIKQNLNNRKLSTPVYLSLYYDYISNKMDRWVMDSDMSINGASNSIPDYNWYKLKLQMYKLGFMSKFPFMYTSNVVFSQMSDSQTPEEYIDSLGITENEPDIKSTAHRLDLIFQSNQVYHKMYEHIFVFNYFSQPIVLQRLLQFSDSEFGGLAAWREIVTMRDEMQKMLAELSEVAILSPGQKTENGTSYYNFTEEIYSSVYDKLFSLYESLDSYVTTQQTLDMIEKASITFTLAQYSANFVEDGFDFTIRNRAYTLNTSVSAQRLAEYVYGGEFLSKYGVYAQYTSPEFRGIVQTAQAYDDRDEFVKTKLTLFPLLRQFASKMADYTAKIYFLTNLKDTSANVSDSLLLTDNVFASDSYLNVYFGKLNTSLKTSPEYLILDHIISQEELSADTLLRLIFSDTSDSLKNMGCTDDYLVLLAKYLEGIPMNRDEYNRNSSEVTAGEATDNGIAIANLSDNFKLTALRRYLAFVQTTSSRVKSISSTGEIENLPENDIDGYYGLYLQNGYNSYGALSNGADTASERMHRVFVNVITYLTLSDEQSEENDDLGSQGEPVNFDEMNFQKLKAFLMKSIASYQKNEQETGAENSSRYLTLFNLISGEFNLSIPTGTGGAYEFIGRTLPAIYNYKDTSHNCVLYNDAQHDNQYNIDASFLIDRSTRGTILKLCGIENRPIEELVNLEYNELYQRDGNYDEAKNDVFVVCSYDEDLGKYIPFMATNRKYSGNFYGTSYMDYLTAYGHNIYTDYYDSPTGTRFAYPIIAKGLLTADLKPTAIRMVNNQVDFYRTDITASSEVDDEALSRVSVAGETTTIGYVKYVSYSSFNNTDNKSANKMNYLATNDITSYVNSGASVYYLQRTTNYAVNKIDDFDGISVLDDFSSFFKMSFQMHFMMVLGFITLIPLLFKASGAVLRRILDLIFLVLIGPLCISMNSLNYNDQEHQTYSSWKKYLTETLLSVIGLVICFNLYYIMVSTTMNMTFVTEGDATMQKLSLIGGLSFVTARLLNGFIKFIFIIVATNMIQTAADMLANMITGGKVTKSFGSPLANGENAIDSIINLKNQVVGDLNKALTGLQDVISGKILLEAKNALIESLPGSKIVQSAASGIGNIKNFHKSRQLYKQMRAKGVNPVLAKAFQKEFRNNYKKQKQQKQQRRQQYAQSFYGRFGAKATY